MSASTTDPVVQEKKPVPVDKEGLNKNGQLGALEEDDEFEEFEAEEWDEHGEDSNDNLWENNWDDDDVEQDFAIVLESESVDESEPMKL